MKLVFNGNCLLNLEATHYKITKHFTNMRDERATCQNFMIGQNCLIIHFTKDKLSHYLIMLISKYTKSIRGSIICNSYVMLYVYLIIICNINLTIYNYA